MWNMKKLTILILLFVTITIFSENSVDKLNQESKENPSKESENKENLSQKKHKFILKGQIGFLSKYRIPDVDIDKKEMDIYNTLTVLNGGNIFGVYRTNNETISPLNTTFGFEYRFLDRFRFLSDQRVLDSRWSPKDQNITGENIFLFGRRTLTLKGKYNYSEKLQKFGFAYYHPITNFLRIGAILRNYKIEQTTRQSLSVNYNNINALLPATPVTQDIESKTIYQGLVPGLGVEIPIGKNIEMRYTLELVNLKGNDNTTAITKFIFPVGFYSETSSLTYKGNIQNFELGFTIPKAEFFIIRTGYTRERLQRKVSETSNFSDSGIPSLTSYIVNNVLSKDIIVANVNFDNLYAQFEFAIGF